MANLKNVALDLAIATLVNDLVTEHKDTLRHQLATDFDDNGSDSVKVTVGDDRIGKISLVEPKAKTFVADESALFAWVLANRDNEIVTEIRESFKKYLLDNCDVLDDGTAVLTTTGEVIPGISARKSNAYVSVRFEKDGRDKLGRALQNGEVSFALPTITRMEIEGNNE
jgi:hypothetical protein